MDYLTALAFICCVGELLGQWAKQHDFTDDPW